MTGNPPSSVGITVVRSAATADDGLAAGLGDAAGAGEGDTAGAADGAAEAPAEAGADDGPGDPEHAATDKAIKNNRTWGRLNMSRTLYGWRLSSVALVPPYARGHPERERQAARRLPGTIDTLDRRIDLEQALERAFQLLRRPAPRLLG